MPAHCKDKKGELEKIKRRIGEDRKTKRQNLMGEETRRGRRHGEERKTERIYFLDDAPLNYLYKAGVMMHLI